MYVCVYIYIYIHICTHTYISYIITAGLEEGGALSSNYSRLARAIALAIAINNS